MYAVDFATGELHLAVPPIMRHLKNSFASETPVTDGEQLYVYFGSIGLVAALRLKGETRPRTGWVIMLRAARCWKQLLFGSLA